MKGQPRRNWGAARAKVESEGCCRRCGSLLKVEAAHVLGRALDRRDGYKVLPERIVPLCGATNVGWVQPCHGRYDRREIDLWHLLTLEEQFQAIDDAGGFWLAVKRAAPLAYKEANQVAA